MKRVLVALLYFGSLCLTLGHVVHAETYDVSAVVPYNTPTIPATIDPSLSGSTTSTRLLRLLGSCEVSNPANVIIVIRQTQVLGSASCSASGTYELSVDLVYGVNSFIARTSNLNGVYGPDSQGSSITYVLPPVSASPAVRDSVSDLNISIDQSFLTLGAGQKSVTVTVLVDGGVGPYLIELNWGDGSTVQKSVDSPGSYTFTHEYAKSASFQVRALVTDVLGVSRMQFFAVVSGAPVKRDDSPAKPATSAGILESRTEWAYKWWSWLLFLVIFILGLFIGAKVTRRQMLATKNKRKRTS